MVEIAVVRLDESGRTRDEWCTLVAGGNAYLSPKVTRQVLDRLPAVTARPDADRDKVSLLSDREREVLTLLAQRAGLLRAS